MKKPKPLEDDLQKQARIVVEGIETVISTNQSIPDEVGKLIALSELFKVSAAALDTIVELHRTLNDPLWR